MSAQKSLLLDVGNSRVKWALADDGVLDRARAVGHDGDPAAVIAAIDAPGVSAVHIANVTGAVHAEAIRAAVRARFDCEPRFAASEASALGVRSAYADPSRLGVDRWLGLLAAWSRAGRAACIVSCGTALTFDALDASGQHLGGIIAPGLLTAQKAVLGATRFAAAGPEQSYSDGLGTDTEACVRQGALHACAGLVERLSARQPGALRLLTGGDAERLLPMLNGGLEDGLDGDWHLLPDLVLEGLLALASAKF